MLKKKTSHLLDEESQQDTASCFFWCGLLLLFVGGVILWQEPSLNASAQDTIGIAIFCWPMVIVGALGVAFGLLIPNFKFEKYPSFESLSQNKISRRK